MGDALPTVSSTGSGQRSPSPITLFVAAASCTALEPQGLPFGAEQEDAIREVLRSEKLRKLPLDAPEVSREPRGAVDLKLLPGTNRTLHALSKCEQMALLSAISKTLTCNPRWGIERVAFTERGSLLAL